VRGRNLVYAGLTILVLVSLGTYFAGEQREVVVLRTLDERGVRYDTKLWVVDLGAVTWVRVARPDRPWYHRLRANPRVELVRGGRVSKVLAIPEDSGATRSAVDEAFRAKYGLVDRWYGLLVRRDAIPIRLVPEDAAD
jgi:hypothetical protein